MNFTNSCILQKNLLFGLVSFQKIKESKTHHLSNKASPFILFFNGKQLSVCSLTCVYLVNLSFSYFLRGNILLSKKKMTQRAAGVSTGNRFQDILGLHLCLPMTTELVLTMMTFFTHQKY